MNKLALFAAAGLLLAGFGAPAMAAMNNSDDAFQKADSNKDGMVSMDEAMGVFPTLSQSLFNQADANHDGKLDAGEFSVLEGLSAGTGNNNDNASKSSSSAPK